MNDNTIKTAPAPGQKTAVAGSIPKGTYPPTAGEMRLGRQKTVGGLSAELITTAIGESFRKLNPRTLMRNPVMFVVEVVALLTTVLVVRELFTGASILFSAQIAFWLWFTVIFANLAEAVAEGRGKAQADNLRRMRTETMAKRLVNAKSTTHETVPALDLKAGDFVLVEAGDVIPSDWSTSKTSGAAAPTSSP